ncbi:unnamed protein product [Acidithrix sp. C25]|nr:unnamed protein product [Acidithrix sp. C25]
MHRFKVYKSRRIMENRSICSSEIAESERQFDKAIPFARDS